MNESFFIQYAFSDINDNFGDNCLRFGVKLDIGKLDNGNHKEMTLKSILNSMNIHTVLYIF